MKVDLTKPLRIKRTHQCATHHGHLKDGRVIISWGGNAEKWGPLSSMNL